MLKTVINTSGIDKKCMTCIDDRKLPKSRAPNVLSKDKLVIMPLMTSSTRNVAVYKSFELLSVVEWKDCDGKIVMGKACAKLYIECK